ncbi:hypothetical protein MZG68_09100, partial [Escherichia coli]|nr:hypothetical protein [Escherichia coli]
MHDTDRSGAWAL